MKLLTKLLSSFAVNFEHTFTLSKDFSVASIGMVEDKEELIKEYQKVQKMMYDRHHAFRSKRTVGEGKDDGHAEKRRVGPSSEKG